MIFNQHRNHLKALTGYAYDFSINQVHQYSNDQNAQKLYRSHLEFKPIHKFFRVTISSIKYAKHTNTDIIALHVYQNSSYKITFPLSHLGYCNTNTTFYPTQERAYRVINISKLLDNYQSIATNNSQKPPYFTNVPNLKINR